MPATVEAVFGEICRDIAGMRYLDPIFEVRNVTYASQAGFMPRVPLPGRIMGAVPDEVILRIVGEPGTKKPDPRWWIGLFE